MINLNYTAKKVYIEQWLIIIENNIVSVAPYFRFLILVNLMKPEAVTSSDSGDSSDKSSHTYLQGFLFTGLDDVHKCISFFNMALPKGLQYIWRTFCHTKFSISYSIAL